MRVPGTRNASSRRRCSERREPQNPPPQQHGADREPGADRRQQHEVALLQPAAAHGVVQRQRDRGRRRVAEPLDVDDRPSSGRAPSFSAADWMIRRLAWCETNRSMSSAVRPLRSSSRRADLLGLAHRELEDRLPVLLHVVQPLVDGLVRRRPAGCRRPACTAPGRRCRRSRARSRESPPSSSVGGRDDHRAGAVAEQHAGRAIVVVDDARHHVGADDQRVLVRAGRHQLAGRRQRVGERRAGRARGRSPTRCCAPILCCRGRRCSETSCPA